MAIHSEAFVHSHALVDEGAIIGARTRVWAFSHILPGAEIGEDCNLCDHTFVEGKVRLGDRVTVKSGVYLWDGIVTEDDVFFGPSAVVTNDKNPRSRQWDSEIPETIFHQGASIGAGAVILPGIELGAWCMIGAGAVVTKSVPNHALMVGNPALLKAYICKCGQKLKSTNMPMFSCEVCGQKFTLNAEKQPVLQAE